MIYINKSGEPARFAQYRNSRNSKFDDMDQNVKKELRESLLQEQKYLCAYCMSRIKDDGNVKIEHFRARNDDNELEYTNLLAVCKGNEGQPYRKTTCDTRKGNKSMTINPLSQACMGTIEYRNDGTIFSTDETYDNDINDILNLNCEEGYLKRNRKDALYSLKSLIRKELKPGESAETLLRRLKRGYENQNNVELKEYVGILLFHIDKKLRKYE